MGNQMEKRPPSGKWYILSIAMFLGAIGISIYGIANFWEHLDTKEQKLPLPASGCIKIDTPGVYNVGFEYHDDYADFDLSRLKTTIKKLGSNVEIPLRKFDYPYKCTDTRTNISSHMLYDFPADTPGDYMATTNIDDFGVFGKTGISIVVEKELGTRNIISYAVTTLLSGLMLCGAIALFLITLILRITRKPSSPPPPPIT